ncbi:MAG: CHAT domain-containing protein [Chitinophagaceae bacterium]
MQHNRWRNKKYLLQFIIGCYCILLSGAGEPQSNNFPVPSSLQQQLNTYQKEDNLSEWIYTQIQWVSEARAARANLLKQATEQIWRDPQTPEEQQAFGDLLINEGHAQLLGGNIVASTDAYRAALKWSGQHNDIFDDAQILEYIIKPLGNNYTRLGDYEQARYIQNKALQVALTSGNKDAIAATYSNLATTASSMGLPEQSVEYCKEGLKIADPGQALYGLLLCELADASFALQRADSARININKGIAILEKHTKEDASVTYWLLMAYQQAGDMYPDQPVQAMTFYNKALALQTRLVQASGTVRVRERAKLFYRLGSLYTKQQQYSEGEHWLKECLALLLPGADWQSIKATDLYGENTLVDVLYTKAVISNEQHRIDESLRLFDLCFLTEKKLRNEYVTGSSRERSVALSRRRYEAAIDAAYNAWEQTKQPVYRMQVLRFMESGKAQLLLDEVQWQRHNSATDSVAVRIQLLEKALVYYERNRQEKGAATSDSAATDQQKKIEWELADLRKQYRTQQVQRDAGSEGVSYEEILKTVLPKGQVARSFFAGEHAVYSVEADSTGVAYVERNSFTPAGRDSVRSFVQQYFQDGPNAMLNHPRTYYEQAYALWHWLLGNHPFQQGKQYVILPDGVLNLLPLDALVTKPQYNESVEQWPFVVQQAVLSYAYSLQTLWQQYQLPATGKGVAGFFIAEHAAQQPSLNAVLQEQEGIGKIITKGNWLFNEQATSKAFHTALQENAVIHISTHAFAGKDSADAPHIQLYDAPFYLFELKEQQQQPAMVVLSACRTGDGRLITGEGVQSLARAFTATGTHAVVAGWWNVHDETAATLVTSFYASLVKQPNAAMALRDARLHWLHNTKTAYQHKLPYYWAALNYHGQPSPLTNVDWVDAAPVFSWRKIGVIAVVALLLLYFVMGFRRRKR